MIVGYSRAALLIGVGAFAVAPRAWPQAIVSSNSRVITPAEHARGLDLYPNTGLTSETGQRVPQDQLDATIVTRAKQWIALLQTQPVRGLQFDPMGRLYLATSQDALAKQQFDARIATPKLSVSDQAYTLLLACELFGDDATNTSRMAIAQSYLTKLDALQGPVLNFRFTGHFSLAYSYYVVGDGDHVRTQINQALALVPAMSFERRNWREIGSAFLLLANVLSGLSNGRSQIDSIGKWLQPYTQASPALIARDSEYYWRSRTNYSRDFQPVLQMASYLGRPAPAIHAQYWWNTTVPTTASLTAPGALAKSLDDGKIRILEYGDLGCGACQAALPLLDRMRRQFPQNVEAWYVTKEPDYWGATRCTPDEVAEHLKQIYLNQKRLGLPIALWIGPRHADVDGGSLNQSSPNFEAFAIRAVPVFAVTDGHGLVRHITVGFHESLMRNTAQYLVGEAARTNPARSETTYPGTTQPDASHSTARSSLH